MVSSIIFRILKFYILAHALFSVAGCGGGGGCIAPDDFGSKKASVNAYVAKGSSKFSGEDDPSITTDYNNANQVIRWHETDFVTNGKNIIIRVDGMWTAWAGNEGRVIYDGRAEDVSKVYDDNADPDKFTPKKSEVCDQYDSVTREVNGGTTQCKKIKHSDTPCWFKNGHGLYILLKRPNDPNPNGNIDTMRVPVSPTRHVGYADGENGIGQFFWDVSDATDPATGNKITIEEGWKIYLKILDRYYYDNAGEYKVTFIAGIYDPTEGAGIFEYVRKLVAGKLLDASKTIFKNVTSDNEYVKFVKTILILFIVFTGIAYLIGMVQQKQSDVIVRIIKIAIVLQLIQPNSWEFFYDHFFVLFIEGTNQVIAVINSHNLGYDLERPFKFMDDFITQRLFSSQTWAKISSIFLTNILGFLWFLVLFLVILYFVYCCAIAFIAYLVALVAVSVVIIIFPISLLAMLFAAPLRNIFDAWITQIASFAFQAVLSFSLLSFFFGVIMNFIYRNLGYVTCDRGWFQIRLCLFYTKHCESLYTFEGWVPGRSYKKVVFGFFDRSSYTNFLPAAGSLGFSEKRYEVPDTKAVIPVPPEYKVHEERYVDIPYLHPVADKDRIDAIFSNSVYFFGDVFYVPELFNLLLFAFIISALRNSVQAVGRFISGGSLFAPVVGAGMPLVNQFIDLLKGATIGRYQDWIGAKTDKVVDLKDKVSRALWTGATAGLAGDMMHRATGASDSVSNRIKDALEKDEKYKFLHAAQDAIGGSLEHAKGRTKALTDLAALKAMSSLRAMDADELHGDHKWNYRRHMEAVMFPYLKRKDDSDLYTSRGGNDDRDRDDDRRGSGGGGDDNPPDDRPDGDQPIVSRNANAATVQPPTPSPEEPEPEDRPGLDEPSWQEEQPPQPQGSAQEALQQLEAQQDLQKRLGEPEEETTDPRLQPDPDDSNDDLKRAATFEELDLPDGYNIGDDSGMPPGTHAAAPDNTAMADDIGQPQGSAQQDLQKRLGEPEEETTDPRLQPDPDDSNDDLKRAATFEELDLPDGYNIGDDSGMPPGTHAAAPDNTAMADDIGQPQGEIPGEIQDAGTHAAAFVDTEPAVLPSDVTGPKAAAAAKGAKIRDNAGGAGPDSLSVSGQKTTDESGQTKQKKGKLSTREKERDDRDARLIDLQARKEELERLRRESYGQASLLIRINEELISIDQEIAELTDR